MNRYLVILWLLVFTDSVAAFVGSRAAWAMRRDPESRELATALGIGLFCYALSRFGSTVNGVFNADGMVIPPGYLTWVLPLSCVQAIGIWVIALTLLNGRTPGILRRSLTKLLTAFDRNPPALP